MAKVIKFPVPESSPEKFGLQRVKRSKEEVSRPKKGSQLNLFTGGKIIAMHQLSAFDEALIYDERGDTRSARAHYLKSIKAGESVADAYCNLGILETQEGKITKAIDCFTRCLEAAPRHFEAHYNLANLYAEVGNYNLAKIHYEVSIEIEPTFPNSYYNLGLTLALTRQFKDAVRVLGQYRQLTPGEEHNHTDDLIAKLSTAG